MTEDELLTCTDSRKMLKSLRGQTSGRKLRLFACACCQLLGDKIESKGSRRAVEVAERFADGLLSPKELALAGAAARAARHTGRYHKARRASYACTYNNAQEAAERVAQYAAWAKLSYARQADLLRCLFGPHRFRPFTLDPTWLAWNDGTIPKIAQAIYDERGFEDLPILADALEDAGCDNEDILAHCRGPGPHVKGCWVLDLLLGKE